MRSRVQGYIKSVSFKDGDMVTEGQTVLFQIDDAPFHAQLDQSQAQKAALVAQMYFLGLLWAWVANTTGSILWTAVGHILIDFSALGWGVLFTAPSSRDEALTVTFTATGITPAPPPRTVNVTVKDSDSQSLVVSPAMVTMSEGTMGSFTVKSPTRPLVKYDKSEPQMPP